MRWQSTPPPGASICGRRCGNSVKATGGAIKASSRASLSKASAAGLATALNLARDEATVLELSWYGVGDVPVPLGGAFHSRRLKLISSQVGKVAPSHRASWTHRRRLEAALAYTADPRLDVLLTPAVPFKDLPARLPQILAPGSGILCQRIDYA